jgi:hypothetical protein
MAFITFVLSSILGLSLNHILTHPKSKINKKLPFIKIKCFQISPFFGLKLKTKSIHIHHWVSYSLILIITITITGGSLINSITNGFLIGSIVQGISYPDWKKTIYENS